MTEVYPMDPRRFIPRELADGTWGVWDRDRDWWYCFGVSKEEAEAQAHWLNAGVGQHGTVS